MKYVYRIVHKPTGFFYYGAKYGKDANPDTFWVDYFTSSERIASLIEKYGKDSFKIKIIKCGFETNDECLTYEGKLILKTYRNEYSLNFRHSLMYAGVDQISIEKMLKTRKENDSYITGSKKRLETLGEEGIKNIVNKTAKTKRERGYFEQLSEKVKQNGIGYVHKCEHCGKEVKGGNFAKWHGDNCKNNPNITEQQLKCREPHNKGVKLADLQKHKISERSKGLVTCYDTIEKCNKKVSKEEFDVSPHLKGIGSKGTPSYKEREVSIETREKLSKAGKCRIFSDEHKKKLSAAAKKRKN